MADVVDLTRPAQALSDVVGGVRDDQLGLPTPCAGLCVGDLVDHADGLAVVFAAAAAKNLGPITAAAPIPSAAHLTAGWRAALPGELAALAAAWSDPAAWDGMTQVGGIDLPGQVAGWVALHELVLHGWDIARATGHPYALDEASLATTFATLRHMYPPEHPERRTGIFGPPLDVGPDTPPLDRVVAFSGRDPGWSAGA
jgi:uncharacterized protein (TIGR03086 family)